MGSAQQKMVIAASFVAGALLMLLVISLTVGFSDVEHAPVPIVEANQIGSGAIELVVGSCNGAPTATIEDGTEPPRVEVRAFRFKSDQDSCLDTLEIFLPQGSGASSSELLDAHTGEIVEIGSAR